MAGVLLAVQWGPGSEDPHPTKWVVAPFLPKLLHATSVTIGRKTRSQESFAQASDPHKRHEGRHIWQQAQWPALARWFWIVWYVLWPPFRKRKEADAKLQENMTYPRYRVIGVIH